MASSQTNLIVNYIPQGMSENELGVIFSKMGPFETIKIMKDFKTGYSYGFAFINYIHPESAQKAIETLNGLQIENKFIKVSYSRPSGDEIKNTNLYITGVPRHYTELEITNVFAKFGRIVQTNVLKHRLTGMPRGVAFVRFDKQSEAQLAIQEMDGKVPEGGSEMLSVKLAENHGKQKAAYFAGLTAGLKQGNFKNNAQPKTLRYNFEDYNAAFEAGQRDGFSLGVGAQQYYKHPGFNVGMNAGLRKVYPDFNLGEQNSMMSKLGGLDSTPQGRGRGSFLNRMRSLRGMRGRGMHSNPKIFGPSN